VSTPAVVGICLGATLFLFMVAALSCHCYCRHSTGKKCSRGGRDKPLALQQRRRPTAVKSPAGSTGTHYLKKSPSPTGTMRSPSRVRHWTINKTGPSCWGYPICDFVSVINFYVYFLQIQKVFELCKQIEAFHDQIFTLPYVLYHRVVS
jgi:hypothetical protein